MEIERKFLVPEHPEDLERWPATRIEQGYLAIGGDGTEVRIRRRDGDMVLTVKGGGGRSRTEEEFGIDEERFARLWPLTEGRRLEKTRHVIAAGEGVNIEVDVYAGELAGLSVAEVEFGSEEAADAFEPPAWFGREVTDDARFKNQRLASEGLPERGSSRRGYRLVDPADVANWHEGTDVPGDYRPLTEALDARQLAATFAEVPPHTDFERGVGHFHEELEEIYLVSRGTLTMRCGDDVMHISAPTAVRVDPKTPRSYRNEGDDRVEMWIVSRLLGHSDSTKVPEFWSASLTAARRNR